MCGIAGFIRRSGKPDSKAVLDGMLDRMIHRGPDDAGSRLESFSTENASRPEKWELALGHRRLAIIDLKTGHQPISNEDGAIWITFNGEIYNFAEIADELSKKGHRFATKTDTEVIVHLYEERGLEALPELNGMFAFAIWDSKARRLLLARDRAGVKPLFYMPLSDGGIAFASELTALLQFPSDPSTRALSRDALAAYFFRDYFPHPMTPFAAIRKLEPGHSLVWTPDRGLSEPAAYWRLGALAAEGAPKGDTRALADRLRELAETAVRRQLVSDVPLGVFLSGGIDSSLVAALASRHVAGPLRTFSITFDDPSFDEGSYARLVARHIRSEHTEEALGEELLIDTISAALSKLDEPLADPSLIPTYLLSRLAARHVKVALGGDGGDELWGGYPTYRAHRYGKVYAAIPQLMRDTLVKPLVSALPVDDRYQSFEWKAKRFTERWDEDPFLRHARWMSGTDLPDLVLAVPGSAWTPSEAHAPLTDLNSVLALDFGGYLPGSVLAKVDRASMAHSLETRPPLLDNEMIDFAFSLPAGLKLHGETSKYLLKLAAEPLLPQEVVHRPKKGFAIPLSRWMRAPLRPMLDSVLKDSPLWGARALNRETFATWNTEHQERRKDRSKPLWALIVLDHWMRKENLHVAF